MVDYFRRYMWYVWLEGKRKVTGSRRRHCNGTTHYITYMLYIIIYVQSHTITGVFNAFSVCNMTSPLGFYIRS